MNVTKKTGKLAAAQVIADSDEVYVLSEKAQVIRTNLAEIRSTGRSAQGVTIFKPSSGDFVSSIACVGEFEVPEPSEEIMAALINGKQKGKNLPK